MRAGGGTGKSRMILEVIPSKITSGCLRHGFNSDLKAERFESLIEFVLERFRVEAIEVVSPKIPIQELPLRVRPLLRLLLLAVPVRGFSSERQFHPKFRLARNSVPVHTRGRTWRYKRRAGRPGCSIDAVGLTVQDAADLVPRRVPVLDVEDVE